MVANGRIKSLLIIDLLKAKRKPSEHIGESLVSLASMGKGVIRLIVILQMGINSDYIADISLVYCIHKGVFVGKIR